MRARTSASVAIRRHRIQLRGQRRHAAVLHLRRLDVEAVDRLKTTLSCQERAPVRIDVRAETRREPEAAYDDGGHVWVWLPRVMGGS